MDFFLAYSSCSLLLHFDTLVVVRSICRGLAHLLVLVQSVIFGYLLIDFGLVFQNKVILHPEVYFLVFVIFVGIRVFKVHLD